MFQYIQTINITSIDLYCLVADGIQIWYCNKQYFSILYNRHRNNERLLYRVLRNVRNDVSIMVTCISGGKEYTHWLNLIHVVQATNGGTD
jgi:hypothetical protein